MGTREQPTARQVRLGSILRGLREEGGRGSQDTVARALGWSQAKLNRIEGARIGIGERDLAELLDHYRVDDAGLRAYVLELRERGSIRGWDTDIRSTVSAKYADYIGYESDARSAFNAETVLVPGLLQTHEYAAAVLGQHLPDITDGEREERLSIRAKRVSVFERATPFVLWCVLSESVFRHAIGGSEVMAAQIDHILMMVKDYPDTINVHVLPETSGRHGALFGPFVILAFQERWEPDIVYLDGLTSNRFLEETTEVQAYSSLFRRLMMNDSLRREDSIKLMESHRTAHRKG